MRNKMSHDDVLSFIECQLSCWPLAKTNYDALSKVKRREVALNGFPVNIQWNPGRIISTGAKVSESDISARPCFLCKDNRPREQHICDILPEWEMLVNPYPILPVHLTIVATTHRPQERVPDDIVSLAELLPGMVVFFNGAKAGASAPDHAHLQAVLKDELPLLRFVERLHTTPGISSSKDLDGSFPYLFFSGIVRPDSEGLRTLAAGLNLGGLSRDGIFNDRKLVNTFFWISEDGLLRFVVVPRKAHRPSCYFAEGETKRLISPGCIDMAGLLVAPRKEDFERLTSNEIKTIFKEVALTI